MNGAPMRQGRLGNCLQGGGPAPLHFSDGKAGDNSQITHVENPASAGFHEAAHGLSPMFLVLLCLAPKKEDVGDYEGFLIWFPFFLPKLKAILLEKTHHL